MMVMMRSRGLVAMLQFCLSMVVELEEMVEELRVVEGEEAQVLEEEDGAQVSEENVEAQLMVEGEVQMLEGVLV